MKKVKRAKLVLFIAVLGLGILCIFGSCLSIFNLFPPSIWELRKLLDVTTILTFIKITVQFLKANVTKELAKIDVGLLAVYGGKAASVIVLRNEFES